MFDITIIIPHKNTPELLSRCLDSIPLLYNIGIIIVDDNSDNKIVNFNCFPGAKRKNTRIIFTKEGRGAGYARNVGLEEADSKWIVFADADDYFMPDSFRWLFEYTSKEYDIVYFDAMAVMEDGKTRSRRVDYYHDLFEQNDMEKLRYTAHVPWGKLIKHSLIKDNNIRFEETMVANDAIFSCRIALLANRVFVDRRYLYCVTENTNSLRMRKQSKEDRITRFEVTMRYNRLLKDNGKNAYYMMVHKWLFDSRHLRDWLPLKYIIEYLCFFKFRDYKQAYWFFKYAK